MLIPEDLETLPSRPSQDIAQATLEPKDLFEYATEQAICRSLAPLEFLDTEEGLVDKYFDCKTQSFLQNKFTIDINDSLKTGDGNSSLNCDELRRDSHAKEPLILIEDKEKNVSPYFTIFDNAYEMLSSMNTFLKAYDPFPNFPFPVVAAQRGMRPISTPPRPPSSGGSTRSSSNINIFSPFTANSNVPRTANNIYGPQSFFRDNLPTNLYSGHTSPTNFYPNQRTGATSPAPVTYQSFSQMTSGMNPSSNIGYRHQNNFGSYLPTRPTTSYPYSASTYNAGPA